MKNFSIISACFLSILCPLSKAVASSTDTNDFDLNKLNIIALRVYAANPFTCDRHNNINYRAALCYRPIKISHAVSGIARSTPDTILINSNWLAKLNDDQIAFIIAHELAHHINDQSPGLSSKMSSRESELRADLFAGFILKRASYDARQISNFLRSIEYRRILSFPLGTYRYPSYRSRRAVIEISQNIKYFELNGRIHKR